MNFFERREHYKSGQNPTPTQEEFEQQMVKVGDKWWPRGMVSRRDIYYGKPEKPQTPPIPPNARSFGNERPPFWMRKPPMNKGVSEMSTKIIVDKRRTGKTTKAIEESGKTFKYILVPSPRMAEYIFRQSLEMGIDIPYPVTIDAVLNKHVSHHAKREGFIIDEGLMLLETILGAHVHMITISEIDEVEAE
jgi:hypothetical protein